MRKREGETNEDISHLLVPPPDGVKGWIGDRTVRSQELRTPTGWNGRGQNLECGPCFIESDQAC